MDKALIKFLIKSGFTLDEIMEMNPEENKEKEEPEQIKTEEPKKEEDNNVDNMLSELKTELKELREAVHKQNRENTFIEPKPVEKVSFEDDIEKLIEEVTK